MSTAAAIGHGSKFNRSSDGTSGGTMTALAGITSINGLSLSRDVVDATDMDSTDRYREFISGLRDGGEVTIGLEFDPDGGDYENAITDFEADTVGYYEIVFPDTSEWGFSAFLTGVSVDDPLDDKMTAEFTYKVTGKPAFTAVE